MKEVSDMDRRFIEKAAEKLIEEINYCNGEVDIIEVASCLGFKIGNASLSNNEDGFVIIDKSKSSIFDINTNKLIGVNCNRTLDFKRYVIAHELGQCFLHYDPKVINGKYAHRLHIKGNNEIDADYFASCLLMPASDFLSKYNELKDKITTEDTNFLLAKKFNVPSFAVENRINDITLQLV